MRFALMTEPIDYQLSIHYNNYEQCYGVGSFVRDLYYLKDKPTPKALATMHNFIVHYGRNKIENFLTEVIQLKGVA